MLEPQWPRIYHRAFLPEPILNPPPCSEARSGVSSGLFEISEYVVNALFKGPRTQSSGAFWTPSGRRPKRPPRRPQRLPKRLQQGAQKKMPGPTSPKVPENTPNWSQLVRGTAHPLFRSRNGAPFCPPCSSSSSKHSRRRDSSLLNHDVNHGGVIHGAMAPLARDSRLHWAGGP